MHVPKIFVPQIVSTVSTISANHSGCFNSLNPKVTIIQKPVN